MNGTLPSSLAAASIGAGLLLGTLAAHAQVHRCIVNGVAAYQARPCGIEPRVAAAAAAASMPAAPKKKTLADLLRERDGANPVRPVVREYQPDGANVLRSRMGAV